MGGRNHRLLTYYVSGIGNKTTCANNVCAIWGWLRHRVATHGKFLKLCRAVENKSSCVFYRGAFIVTDRLPVNSAYTHV